MYQKKDNLCTYSTNELPVKLFEEMNILNIHLLNELTTTGESSNKTQTYTLIPDVLP